jgi:hypothetical protein
MAKQGTSASTRWKARWLDETNVRDPPPSADMGEPVIPIADA